jgi:hypothetical protein
MTTVTDANPTTAALPTQECGTPILEPEPYSVFIACLEQCHGDRPVALASRPLAMTEGQARQLFRTRRAAEPMSF